MQIFLRMDVEGCTKQRLRSVSPFFWPIEFSLVYLFAIRNTCRREKEKKSNYLDCHGEEAQKKPVGLL